MFARLAAAVLGGAVASLAHAASGPSVDCAHATGRVTRMICASPDLSARDRTLAERYRALLAQPGTDAADLQREQARWLHDVRDTCPDEACVAQAYDVWNTLLLARSRRTASPAAEGETRPFPVDPALMDDARGLRGKACAPGEDVPRDLGYLPVPGSLPVVGDGSVVLARQRIGAEFAVLLDTRACRRGPCCSASCRRPTAPPRRCPTASACARAGRRHCSPTGKSTSPTACCGASRWACSAGTRRSAAASPSSATEPRMKRAPRGRPCVPPRAGQCSRVG
jgi:uncharacterized protein YecT (DUF1311 family)